jgi:hydroxybutyrate-dimer hydrolase
VQSGMRDALLTGNLRGKPAIIVDGRSDTLYPADHAARAYVAYNSKVEAGRNVRYYEIENGQHFDAYIASYAGAGGIDGYDVLFVPLHYYFVDAMDLLWAKLKNGAQMPPSQVVRTTPRSGTPGAAPPISAANVPKVAADPATGDGITVSAGVLSVPN